MKPIALTQWRAAVIVGCLFSVVGVGWAAPERPAKTWKTCEEMSPQELAEEQIDCRWSKEFPRDPQVTYAPAEDFPFQPPYTGEELMYLSDSVAPRTKGRVSFDLTGGGSTINSRGSLYENQLNATIYYAGQSTYWDRVKKLKGGDVMQYVFAKYNLPPSNYGFGLIEVDYKIVPGENSKQADRWLFLPSLRKVRRVPSPRREDVVPQYDFTFDDNLGRPPYEYDHRVVGTDIIYPEEHHRFPDHERPIARKDFSGIDMLKLGKNLPVGVIKPEDYPFARPDGGVECYVVESKPKPDFLPGYYIGRLLSWVDKKNKLLLRVEEYDPKEDKRFFIMEYRFTHAFPELGREGYAFFTAVWWDMRIDHMTSGLTAPYFPMPANRDLKQWFNPQRLLQIDEWFLPINKVHLTIDDPHHFAMRPVLFPGKFPALRPQDKLMANVTPEMQERIKRQDAAWRLVFDGEY